MWLLVALVGVTSGCATSSSDPLSAAPSTTAGAVLPHTATSDESPPTIAVTYSVLASLVTALVGDAAAVINVIPDGEDPHTYQPTDTQRQLISNSDFIVANGLHFEAGIDDALESARRAGKPIFYAIDHVTARLANDDDHSHDADDGHNHGDIDLHLWLNPPTMRQMLPELGRQLGEFLGVDLGAAAERLESELDLLDTEILRAMSAVENCTILVNHDEFGYFAERYGCVSQSVPVPKNSGQISAADRATVRNAVRRAGVSTVFVNTALSAEQINDISAAIDSRIVAVPTHAMGSSTTYSQFMRLLVDTLVTALTS